MRALRGTAGMIPEICEQSREHPGLWREHLECKPAPVLVTTLSGSGLSPCPPWSLCPQILERLNKMCGVGEQVRKKQQRLLKNMDAHKVMLDLLQIPYEKVGGQKPTDPEHPGQRGHTGTP